MPPGLGQVEVSGLGRLLGVPPARRARLDVGRGHRALAVPSEAPAHAAAPRRYGSRPLFQGGVSGARPIPRGTAGATNRTRREAATGGWTLPGRDGPAGNGPYKPSRLRASKRARICAVVGCSHW
ncbi:hypothetical protein AB0M95_00930 [Sphaerisporangium sp. NPDC051017]|uniref:hypothetical protein n=1 Tax=Sphaerisporangium sp. NPDC051017 TaxID=3154636 RepID=UPI003447AA6F